MSRFWSCIGVVFVVAVATVACGCSSPPISVSVSPSSAAIDQGQRVAITATVANDTSYPGVSWLLTGPGSLSSSTGPSVTYISPQSNSSSAQQATIVATSLADKTKTASAQITVNPYPYIPFQTLSNGTVGTPYNEPIAVIGGTAPFHWSIYNGPIITGWRVGGAVPDGLTLDPASGVISGTPKGGGTWYFDAMVTDATGVTVDNGVLSIQVNPSAPAGNPVPFLNQPLVPTAVSPGSSAFRLNVSGANFVSGASVDFSGTPVATTFIDSEHLSAEVPAASVATSQTASITVVNPTPGGGPSNVVYFHVTVPETDVRFANAPDSPVTIRDPFGITVADFNEDGKPDLAIAQGTRIGILLGDGDGTFTPAPGSPLPVPSPPFDDLGSPYVQSVVPGDFNHSGHVGLAIGLYYDEAVEILFGNGEGGFAYSPTLAYTRGRPTASLTAADFNADGNLDLVVLNDASGVSPVALLGYSDGAFNSSPILQTFQTPGICSGAGDFNGDGKLDFVVNGEFIMLGHGDGTFTEGAPLNGGVFVAVGDFNGDGKLDLAVADPVGNTVSILLGNGDGTFSAPLRIAVGSQPSAIMTGDFNNDGKLDLAVANFGDNTIALLLGNGDGTFTPAPSSPYPVGKGAYQLAAADFNGDGKLDLAVANLIDGTVSILLQQ